MEYKLYKILNVSKDATKQEIKKSYKKLAIKYHPDKNIDNKEEAEKKFQEIAHAYSILSDDNKRRNYNMTGDNQDDIFMDNINPFEMFNNIFQNHVNNFMNFNTQNNNLHNIINKLRENGSQIYGMYSTINRMNTQNNTQNNSQYSTQNNTQHNTQKKSQNHTNRRNTKIKKEKKIKGKPKLIEVEVETTIEEVYKYTKRDIKIPISNVKEKSYEIPLIGKELLINNIGSKDPRYTENGDVKVNIKIKDEGLYKRINNYDISYKKDIKIYDFYHNKEVEIELPNKELIKVEYDYKKMIKEDNFRVTLENRGMPYLHNKKRGKLVIEFNIILPIEYNELVNNI